MVTSASGHPFGSAGPVPGPFHVRGPPKGGPFTTSGGSRKRITTLLATRASASPPQSRVPIPAPVPEPVGLGYRARPIGDWPYKVIAGPHARSGPRPQQSGLGRARSRNRLLIGRVAAGCHLAALRSFEPRPSGPRHHRLPVTGQAHGRFPALQGRKARNRSGPHAPISRSMPAGMDLRGCPGSWSPGNKRSRRRLWARAHLTTNASRWSSQAMLGWPCSACHSYVRLSPRRRLAKLLTQVRAFPGPDRGLSVARQAHNGAMGSAKPPGYTDRQSRAGIDRPWTYDVEAVTGLS